MQRLAGDLARRAPLHQRVSRSRSTGAALVTQADSCDLSRSYAQLIAPEPVVGPVDPPLRLTPVHSTRSQNRLLVFVVPLDSNPYQECLYGPMRAQHPDAVELCYWRRRPWVGVAQFFPLAAWLALRGSRVAHVHWLAWHIRLNIPGRARLSGTVCRLAIRWLQLLGFRLVWTVHNVVPHEPQTDDDLGIVQVLADASSAVIVHSAVVLDALADKQVATARAIVIPQGSYIGLYGPPPDQEDARRYLGIRPTGRVVLFFGLVRAYKGVPELLAAWSGAPQDGTLLVVGSCRDPALQADIEAAASDDRSIVLHLEFVPDDAVATYVAACDAVCLPFRATTTSSSALLALSFSRPVIAPRLGALQDLPDETGYYYRPDADAGLEQALARFFEEDDEGLHRRGAAGLAFAEGCTWPTISERTYELYRSVAEGPPPGPDRPDR